MINGSSVRNSVLKALLGYEDEDVALPRRGSRLGDVIEICRYLMQPRSRILSTPNRAEL